MGGIIAVSYEARAKGVTRQMSGHEAMKAMGFWGKIDAPKYLGNTNKIQQIFKMGKSNGKKNTWFAVNSPIFTMYTILYTS